MIPGDADADAVLLGLIRQLAESGYRFVTTTPETHQRVLKHKAEARDLRDVFGWNLPFAPALLPAPLFELLEKSGLLVTEAGQYKSRVRVASAGDLLFLHSAFPTGQKDAVFFGPDSYRFVRFLASALADAPAARRLVDIGAGAGVGAIMAAALLPDVRLTLTDINPLALRFARINAFHAGLEVELVEGNGLDRVAGDFDLAISNPPFLVDEEERTYRHGGAMHGAALALEWTLAAARRLAPGGRMLLYTGSAIVAGEDRLAAALRERLPALGCALDYAEIDPDIFGEQLDRPGYRGVERIAAVGAIVSRAGA